MTACFSTQTSHTHSNLGSQITQQNTSTMTRQSSPTALITLLVIAIIGITTGYSSTPRSSPLTSKKSSQPIQVTSQPNNRIVSRHSFLTTAASSACLTFLGTQQPAYAKEVDPAVKGTKADPEFQACLSQCIYECTKPKGAEQKSRGECLPECKTKCATTKAQSSGKIMDRM